MKVVLAIISEANKDALISALSCKNYPVTLLSSSGEFMRYGDVMLLIGVEDKLIDNLISLIREHCNEELLAGKAKGYLYIIDVAKQLLPIF